MTSTSPKTNAPAVSPRLTLVALVAASLAACAGSPTNSAQAPAPVKPVAMAAAQGEPNALGIQVSALRLSAGGFMVDLRYRVHDPELAKVLLDRKVLAYLVDEATGLKFGVPNTAKLGRLRAGAQSEIHTDRDYGMLFGNPGHHLKRGMAVTLVAGTVEVPHLIVQ